MYGVGKKKERKKKHINHKKKQPKVIRPKHENDVFCNVFLTNKHWNNHDILDIDFMNTSGLIEMLRKQYWIDRMQQIFFYF